MRDIIIAIVLLLSFHGGTHGGISIFHNPRLYQSYIILGDLYYNKGVFDSALLLYSIPYFVNNGISPIHTSNDSNTCFHPKHISKLQTALSLKIGKTLYFLDKYNLSIQFLTQNKVSDNNHQYDFFEGMRNYYLGMGLNKIYNYNESLFHYFNSLNHFKKYNNDSSFIVGLIYCDIGNVYYNLGHYNKALEYYNNSSKVIKGLSSPDYSKLSIIENNIGSIYYRLGDYSSAIKYYKSAIKLLHEPFIDFVDLSMYLNNIAGIYLTLDNIDSSKLYYNKSLKIREEKLQSKNLLAQSHNQLGILHFLDCNYSQSLWHFQKAIILNTIEFTDSSIFSNPILQQIIDYRLLSISLYYKAIVLYNKYISEGKKQLNYISASSQTFNLLFQFFKYIYVSQLNQNDLKYYIALNREVINSAIDITYNTQKNFDESIFNLAEQGKSIILYQFLIESNAKEFAGIPNQLVLEEKEIRNDINKCDRSIQIALNEKIDFTNSEKFASLILERNQKIEFLNSLISEFENNYPQYFDLKYDFTPIPYKLIQYHLKKDEAIIEFHISDSILYTIFISHKDFGIYHQKVDSVDIIIKQHIKNIRFYNNDGVNITGRTLYFKLIGQVENYLSDIKKLIIIPDSYLSTFPFETLIQPEEKNINYPNYIIIDFDICYHFSSSLWYKQTATHSKKDKSYSLFACAPGFSSKSNVLSETNLEFSPIPYSREEITAIEQIFKKNNLVTNILYDDLATKQSFLDNASNHSIIHLATHNVFNKDNPELSGIAFYNNVCQNDNISYNMNEKSLLYVDETYNLLLDAELVVLSACMTGVGKTLSGEGTITLYRGFFYSGANNILFTLWNIPDMRTSDFMQTFYNYIFMGDSFVSALQKTKLSYIKNEHTRLPIFWSNFIILGN